MDHRADIPGKQRLQPSAVTQPSISRPGLFGPLREPVYRTIWGASLLSNFGQMIQGVGAAWAMTRLTKAPEMVALVQTAIFLPLMLLSLPAGAIADMYDRRKVAIGGLLFALLGATSLTLFTLGGWLSPWLLLALCFLIGVGIAFYGPAWQASVNEQVGPELLPSAVALGAISYNVARSFGPALGGAIVAAAGAVAAFGLNVLLYLPVIFAFLRWRRVKVPARLPPERIDRAIVAGVRYAMHSPPIRVVVFRSLLSALAGSSVMALAPLIARDLLGGGAKTYGLLLGGFGIGAVLGAAFTQRARTYLDAETAVRGLAVGTGALLAVVGLSRSRWLSLFALAGAGAMWMLLTALFNVGVQLSVPRWVTARALACWGTAVTGGLALGAVAWGAIAGQVGVGAAMTISGAALAMTALVGVWLRMPHIISADAEMEELRAEPEVNLDLTLRSGPIVIEVDYRVDPSAAREFYDAMQDVRRARLRSGAFEWSLARDVADPVSWTERYHCPTWGDYLRQRNRATISDLEAEARVEAFHQGPLDGRVRRRLERPFGSVRWRAESPDNGDGTAGVYTP